MSKPLRAVGTIETNICGIVFFVIISVLRKCSNLNVASDIVYKKSIHFKSES